MSNLPIMVEAGVTIASVLIAAGLAYLAALTGWRRQQRRDVYAQFVAAASTMLETLDRWEMAVANGQERQAAHWIEFLASRKPLEVAVAQLRLVAPGHVIDAALPINGDSDEFSVALASSWSRGDAIEYRYHRAGLSWDALTDFTARARRDIAVDWWWQRRR